MSFYVFILLTIVAVTVLFIGIRKDHDDLGILGLALCVVALFCWGVWTVALIDRWYSEQSCEVLGQQTGREVKFVTFGHYSNHCLTPSVEPGKWVDIDRVIKAESD